MLIKYLLPMGCLLLVGARVSVGGEVFPTEPGSYRDPRSLNKRVICHKVTREDKFKAADLVFFGKFLGRTKDLKRKVFVDQYRVMRVWKGKGDIDSVLKVEVPPTSDFCSMARNGHEVEAAQGGFIIYAKGTPPFIDCCMSDSNELVFRKPSELTRLDEVFKKLKAQESDK